MTTKRMAARYDGRCECGSAVKAGDQIAFRGRIIGCAGCLFGEAPSTWEGALALAAHGGHVLAAREVGAAKTPYWARIQISDPDPVDGEGWVTGRCGPALARAERFVRPAGAPVTEETRARMNELWTAAANAAREELIRLGVTMTREEALAAYEAGL